MEAYQDRECYHRLQGKGKLSPKYRIQILTHYKKIY